MALQTARYDDVRPEILPGDVIAFSGKGHVSEIIKTISRPVSHVGLVRHTRMVGDPQAGRYFCEIVESTMTQAHGVGVQHARLSRRVDEYDGEVWWLPLADDVRGELDEVALFEFLYEQEGKDYDALAAVRAGLDVLDEALGGLTKVAEDFARFFCSELVSAALEAGGVLPEINSSEVHPMDLCRFAIFRPDYYLLRGDKVEIPGVGTLPRQHLPQLFPH